MIIGSLLLILVAVVLLVLGLTNGSSVLLTGSIGASLLAAVALVVGARQDAGNCDAHPDEPLGDGVPAGDETSEPAQPYAMAGRTGRSGHGGLYGGSTGASTQADSATLTLPVQAPGNTGYGAVPPGDGYPGQRDTEWDDPDITDGLTVGVGESDGAPAETPAASALGGEESDEEDPPDEPAPQVTSAADAARVARLTTDVLVIDGRPRYHLPGCVHLLGRESEPLAVGEAVELGFTPCSLCEPDSALLTDPRLG